MRTKYIIAYAQCALVNKPKNVARPVPSLALTKRLIVGGSERIELAKMMGITPDILTLIGICVF